jgi:hypothetical protein
MIDKIILSEFESLIIKPISNNSYSIILLRACFRQPLGSLIYSKEINHYLFNHGELFLKQSHLNAISKLLDKLNI